MSTVVPTAPLVGVNEVIVGGSLITVNDDGLEVLPPGVATTMLPVVASRGTVAWISVSEMTVNSAAAPLNATEVASVKFAPRMSTLARTGPLGGVNELIVGGGPVTVKASVLVPVPPGVVTLMGPVVAPLGRRAWIWESESTV